MGLFVKELKVSYRDKEIIKGISSKFEKGFNLIMGDSGSGKTTFLKALCFLVRFKGEILFENKRVDERWIRVNCKLVIQNGFYTNETIIQTAKKPFEFKHNKDKVFDETKFKELLDLFGLSKFSKDDSVNKLSGGELQRLALIRALLLKPKLFLADEPTSNLDESISQVVYRFLKEFCRNRVCIIVSHDPIAKSFADRIYYLTRGGFDG